MRVQYPTRQTQWVQALRWSVLLTEMMLKWYLWVFTVTNIHDESNLAFRWMLLLCQDFILFEQWWWSITCYWIILNIQARPRHQGIPDQSLQNSFYKCRVLAKMLSSLVLARLAIITTKTRCWVIQQKLSVFLSISASLHHQGWPGKLNMFWHGFWESWICLELLSLSCKAEALEFRYEHKHNESGTQVQTGLRTTSRRLKAEQPFSYFINFFCSWGCRSLYCLKERFMTLVQHSL